MPFLVILSTSGANNQATIKPINNGERTFKTFPIKRNTPISRNNIIATKIILIIRTINNNFKMNNIFLYVHNKN